ncbi:MAG: hypothetical protein JSW46_01945 [Gemmatimonadota bacterium]|nr:MAG: hypothetical protein JSW46_01945 [Gemmatimonadota bacterium]
MRRNRVEKLRGKHDPLAQFGIDPTRRAALLAIEEVLGGPEASTSTTTPELPATLPPPPQTAPRRLRAESPWVRRRRHRRRSRRGKRRPLIVALTAGLAFLVGALVGSGAFNARDRYNAQLIAAQEDAAQVYELPEVQGHPGAAPSRERSGSIREFLGMASAF